jgi:hypothetical protein
MGERAPGRRLDRADAAILAVGAAAVGLFILAEQRIAGTSGLPLDDSWIHLRIARNVATGRGFAINPGEPVAASTAPLWTLALAGLLALGVPALVAAKGLGLACHAALALVVRRAASAAGVAEVPAVAAGLAVAGLARLVWGSLSGMEVPLAALLVAVSTCAVAHGRPTAAALGLGLATLARPEAGLLAALHALGAGSVRGALGRLALVAVVLVPHVVFSLLTVGRAVPATVAAKATGGMVGGMEGLGGAWTHVGPLAVVWGVEWVRVLADDHLLLPVLVGVGLVALRRHPLRWLAAGLLLHPLAAAVVAPYQGPGFQTGRYSSHLLPLAVVVAAAGLGRIQAWWGGRALRATGLAALLLLLVWPLPRAADAYAWGVQNIDAMQVRLGRWIAAHTAPDALLAVNDIGALAYVGNRRVLDLVGLATPEILPYRREGPAGLLRYLERRCPAYLVIFPAWFPELAARADLFHPVTAVTLARNVVAGAPTMVVYRTVWDRDWRPVPAPCPGPAAR